MRPDELASRIRRGNRQLSAGADDPLRCSSCGVPTKEDGRYHPDLGMTFGRDETLRTALAERDQEVPATALTHVFSHMEVAGIWAALAAVMNAAPDDLPEDHPLRWAAEVVDLAVKKRGSGGGT